MRVIDDNTITDEVVQQMSKTENPRLKQIMNAAVRHLHAFAREVDLTPDEWLEGIRFLTAVGQMCTPIRQEFILLSDTLGLSALVNSLHDKRVPEEGTTKSSLFGPFYRQDAPTRPLGSSIAANPGLNEIGIYGRVINAAGQGIPDALVQIWQRDEQGAYDLQLHDASVMDLRGCLRTDAGERYYLPLGYLIPMDGPPSPRFR